MSFGLSKLKKSFYKLIFNRKLNDKTLLLFYFMYQYTFFIHIDITLKKNFNLKSTKISNIKNKKNYEKCRNGIVVYL